MLAVSFYGDDGFRTGTATGIVLGEHLQGQESVAHRAQSSHQNVICNRFASVEFLEQATKVRSCGDMIG
jgi:hypothetical protein